MSDIDPRAALKGLRVLAGFLATIGEVKRYVRMASDGADALAAEIQAHEELKQAFKRYAQHCIGCEKWDAMMRPGGVGECNCDLFRALAVLVEEET